MEYGNDVISPKEDYYISCGGFDKYNNESIHVMSDPQVVYHVGDNAQLPSADDQTSIILDMSNNVKLEAVSSIHTSEHNQGLLHLYTCMNCELRFIHESHLENHYSYCLKKENYEIHRTLESSNPVENNSGTANMNTLVNNDKHRKEEINVCNICSKTFKTAEMLKKHLNRMSNEDAVECNLCKRLLHGPAGYLRHLKTHYGKSCEICSQCGKKFTTLKALIRHQQNHNNENIEIKSKIKCEDTNSCFTCEKTFLSKEKLEKHLKAREGDVPIKCNLCERTLHSSGYEYHMKAHSSLKYQCLICNLKFISLHDLKKHKTLHHSNHKQFFCDVCKKCYKDGSGLKMHLRLHTGETPYSCDICEMKFPFSSTLKYHKKIHSQDHPTLCNICNISFPNIREITTHNRIHEGEKIYRCSCGKLFRLLSSLVIHQKNSKDKCIESTQVFERKSVPTNPTNSIGNIVPKNYLCDKCNRAFHTIKALEKHKRRKIHTVSKEEPICKICGKCFQTLGQLKKHNKVHRTIDETHSCDTCKKTFQHIDKLKAHMSVHSKHKRKLIDEECSCNTCGKVFGNAVSLKKHIRSHTGQRPYTCSVCSATFADRSTLNDHHIVHIHARNHLCNTCGKAFKSSRVLKIHLRVHQPDRPYKCTDCSSSFKHLGTLISHKVTHTGLKAHQCQVCWMKFAYAKGLKRHYKIHKECDKDLHENEKQANSLNGHSIIQLSQNISTQFIQQ